MQGYADSQLSGEQETGCIQINHRAQMCAAAQLLIY